MRGNVLIAGVIALAAAGCQHIATDANGNRALAREAGGTIIIGGRPAGCPRRYCGCALRLYLGIDDKRLDLAANWARLFPRAHPGPGKAVVWGGHVALIEEMIDAGTARLRDYNSGGGLSRIHTRSIAGAIVVDPSVKLAERR